VLINKGIFRDSMKIAKKRPIKKKDDAIVGIIELNTVYQFFTNF
jgi:hypothetical protein